MNTHQNFPAALLETAQQWLADTERQVADAEARLAEASGDLRAARANRHAARAEVKRLQAHSATVNDTKPVATQELIAQTAQELMAQNPAGIDIDDLRGLVKDKLQADYRLTGCFRHFRKRVTAISGVVVLSPTELGWQGDAESAARNSATTILPFGSPYS